MEKAWPWAHPCVPTDGEKLSGVTDGRGVRAALSTQRAEDSSESHEEEQAVSRAVGEHRGSAHGTLQPPRGLWAGRVPPPPEPGSPSPRVAGCGLAWAWGPRCGAEAGTVLGRAVVRRHFPARTLGPLLSCSPAART